MPPCKSDAIYLVDKKLLQRNIPREAAKFHCTILFLGEGLIREMTFTPNLEVTLTHHDTR